MALNIECPGLRGRSPAMRQCMRGDLGSVEPILRIAEIVKYSRDVKKYEYSSIYF